MILFLLHDMNKQEVVRMILNYFDWKQNFQNYNIFFTKNFRYSIYIFNNRTKSFKKLNISLMIKFCVELPIKMEIANMK